MKKSLLEAIDIQIHDGQKFNQYVGKTLKELLYKAKNRSHFFQLVGQETPLSRSFAEGYLNSHRKYIRKKLPNFNLEV